MDAFEQVTVTVEEGAVDACRAGEAGDGDVLVVSQGGVEGDGAGAADHRDRFLDLGAVLVGEVFEVLADALHQSADVGDFVVRRHRFARGLRHRRAAHAAAHLDHGHVVALSDSDSDSDSDTDTDTDTAITDVAISTPSALTAARRTCRELTWRSCRTS
ncbi:hypothetical protein [Streptomyces sp. NPDC088183]|uniref:hypothetical protein n=1 Tax=Streptomyces sp. NPDC088183 TaxID=3160992 RepID=UPI00341879E5